ncbi:MAG: ATP-dependent zinc metalloprotease FtsH, partial [Clostridia bacterium]|nr:ATP-dependent zinc metalloprotease FtsH [Clostridia bacterium]
INGSEFMQMFVGVGASRVRELFNEAKENAPSVVFIDEIDAVGRQRGAGLGGGHDEREQTLNQLLVEMDGFGVNEGVIIIAATNRPDILDPALLRPGRFDRQVMVNSPDLKGREAILKVHARNKPLEDSVDLSVIAKTTPGMTGADLSNLLNEAALLAARRGATKIAMRDVEEATIKVIAGPEKKSRAISEKDRRLTAYHEAGHAVVTRFCATQSPVHEISIVPRGRAGGYTLALPTEDKYYSSRQEMKEEIIVLLAGRVAEQLFLDDISTGASNDIERATDIARKMVTKYGMSERLGPIVYGGGEHEVFLGRDFSQGKGYSEDVAAQIDSEIRQLIDAGYAQAMILLRAHEGKVHQTAGLLLEREKIDGKTFESLFATGKQGNKDDADAGKGPAEGAEAKTAAEAGEAVDAAEESGEQ